MSETLISTVRPRRLEARLSQKVLAERIGLSRQGLIAIEAGRQVPSTAIALRLAAALQCSVEALFRLSTHTLSAHLATDAEPGRVALGQVAGRWVAHPLPPSSSEAADGVLAQTTAAGQEGPIEPLSPTDALSETVLVAGCAPVLGILARHVGRRAGLSRMAWIEAGSGRALRLLDSGLVHVAGTHLVGEHSGEDNLTLMTERFAGQPMLLVHLIRWRQGLVAAAGNPLKLRSVADLARPNLRVAWREPDAGATKLLHRRLSAAGIEPPPGPVVRGHHEVAQAVALGAADVGVAIEAAALAQGLHFIPLSEERFDLVLPAEWAQSRPIRPLLDTLHCPAFRAELTHLAGYDATDTGHTVALGEAS